MQAVLPTKLNNPRKLSQLCESVLNPLMYRAIVDNLDFFKRVRDMRLDHQNMSIHWTHIYFLLNRVAGHLDNHCP